MTTKVVEEAVLEYFPFMAIGLTSYVHRSPLGCNNGEQLPRGLSIRATSPTR